jgi:secreted trypsin-like serine protease
MCSDGFENTVRTTCIFAGDKGQYQVILRSVELSLVSHVDCEFVLSNRTRLGSNFRLDSSLTCAVGSKAGVDTCKGDGGGPLMCPATQGAWQQVGVVSWGIGCGQNGIPGVYANVSSAACFIEWAARCQEGAEAVAAYRWPLRSACR